MGRSSSNAGRWRLAAALVALAVAPVRAAPQERFEWFGWQIPGQKLEERGMLEIVEDEDAESERTVAGEEGDKILQKATLQQRVTRRSIAKRGLSVARTPVVPWTDIAPGVYRVSARVSFDGDLGLIGTPIRLAVTADGRGPVEKEYAPCDFDSAGDYRVLSFLYEVDSAGDPRLPAREARHAWRYQSWYLDIYPNAQIDKPPERKRDKQEGLRVEVFLPQTKYSSFSGMPPNSLRWVRVDWVRLEKIQPSPSLTVRFVRPRKLWIRPGHTNVFETAIENFTSETQARRLRISLHHGLDRELELLSRDIAVAAGETMAIETEWPIDRNAPRWGYEVRAEVLDGDTTDHAASDYFSVHPEVYPVHVMGSNSRAVDPFRRNETYQNLMEVFGATEGDCAGIMPRRGDRWISGMSSGGIAYTFKTVRGTTDHNRERGIATHMYLFAGGTGTPLMDLYIRRPEWVNGRLTATDEMYRLIRAREEEIWAHDFASAPPEGSAKIPHCEQHLSHWFPELKRMIEDQAVEFVRRTGYEGIRFDVGIFAPKSVKTVLGTTLPFDPATAQEHAARNFNDFKDRLRAEFPGFEFGANMDSWAYLEQVGNREVTPKPPEEYPEFVAFANAGGMFMDEGTMSAPFFDHYMNRWEDALWGMCRKRAVAREHGGVYQLFSPHRNGRGHFAHDDIYWAIMIVASGSHYVGSFSAPPYSEDSIGQFITRFSEFFRSPDLAPLESALDDIFVDAPADIWFADAAVWRDCQGKRQYVIPLINPPVADRLRRNKTNELPPPLNEPFEVEIAMPDGFTNGEAWMLTWEPRVMARRLPAETARDTLTVEFPGLQLFRTLVVEFGR